MCRLPHTSSTVHFAIHVLYMYYEYFKQSTINIYTVILAYRMYVRNELQMLLDLKENFEGDKEELQRLR